MSENFFLGAVCGGTFKTEFGDVMSDDNLFTYILKGGAGTGKSSLMKRIAAHFEKDFTVTRFYCSSDPNSLDAVVIHELNAAVCDGTSPHVFEPKYPGISQRYVDLGEYWDRAMLAVKRDNIVKASDRNKYLLECSKYCNTIVSRVDRKLYSIGEKHISESNIRQFSEQLCTKYLKDKIGVTGKASYRRLSVLTEFGYMTLEDTLTGYERLIALNDDMFAAADLLLKLLCEKACSLGYDVIVSPHQMIENAYQHILIPELKTSFVSRYALSNEVVPAEIVDLRAIYDFTKNSEYCAETEVLKRTAQLFSAETARYLHEAKVEHDILEGYFISAMDFKAVDRLTERFISEIGSGVYTDG